MLKFQPILKCPVWGGERIASYKGIDTDQRQIGESWELSGLPGNESVVADGPDKGLTICDVLRRDGEKLVGKANYARFGEEFPLLVKFIDAREDLSVQVHPNEALARERHGCSGKCEAWYVIRADEDARLRVGFNHAVTPEEYDKAVAEHRVVELMAEHRIAPGDWFYLPAGRIHTIGAGTMVAEIQQPSNITYRIYDYDRPGVDGEPRELHTEAAREALDYGCYSDYRTSYTPCKDSAVQLMRNEHFTVTLFDLSRPQILDLEWLDSFVAVVCTVGEGTLRDDKGRTMPIHQGETVLVPAEAKCIEMKPNGEQLKLLVTWIESDVAYEKSAEMR